MDLIVSHFSRISICLLWKLQINKLYLIIKVLIKKNSGIMDVMMRMMIEIVIITTIMIIIVVQTTDGSSHCVHTKLVEIGFYQAVLIFSLS